MEGQVPGPSGIENQENICQVQECIYFRLPKNYDFSNFDFCNLSFRAWS